MSAPIVITHRSSIEFWSALRVYLQASRYLGTYDTRRRDTAQALRRLESGGTPRTSTSSFPEGCTLPLHIMVRDAKHRPRDRALVAHVCSAALPSSSFVGVGEELFASTPELAFLQMAETLSVVELVRLGFDLCGSYATRSDGALLCDRPAVTSVERLRRFAAKAEGARGRRRALRACAFVRDGSASPRETLLAMLLCLPCNLGGYGLPPARLNHRVDVPALGGEARFFVCDLYWPEHRLDVEYDSTEFHAGAEALASDSARRTRLEAVGVRSINFTNAHLLDARLFDGAARDLLRIMHRRFRPRPGFEERHRELRRRLGL